MRRKFLISILLLSLMALLFIGRNFAEGGTITESMLKLIPRLTQYYYKVGDTLKVNVSGTVTIETPTKLKMILRFSDAGKVKSEEYIKEITAEDLRDGNHTISINHDFNSIEISEISEEGFRFASLEVYEVVHDSVTQEEKDVFIDNMRVNPSIALIKNEKPNAPVIEVYKKSDTEKKTDIRDMWINDKDGAIVVLNIAPNITYADITDYRYTLSSAQIAEEKIVPVKLYTEVCEFFITNEGVTEVKARITDKMNRFSDYIEESVRIDRIAPTIEIDTNGYRGGYENGSVKPTIRVVDPGVEGQHAGVDASTFKYFWSSTQYDLQDLTEELFTKENAKEFIHEEQIGEMPTGISGTYYLYVMAKDKAGNIAFQKSEAYLIDEVAPVVNIDKEGNDDYEKLDEISVTVTVKDENGSGVKTSALKYLWEEGTKSLEKKAEDFSESFTSGTPITKRIDSDVETIYYLWIYAEDDVGNATITCTEKGFKVDQKAPTVFTSSENNGSYEHDKTITVTFEDDASGIDAETLKYFWADSETTQDEGSFEKLVATGTSTSNLLEANVVTPNRDGIFYLHLVGQDKLGNQVTLHHGPYHIDVTKPVVNFAPDTNAHELTTKVPTVNVQDQSTVKVYYKWVVTGGKAPNKSSIITPLDENGVQAETKDGNYTLYVYAVDEAGNETIANSGNFEINMKIPNAPSIVAQNDDAKHSEIPNGASTNGNVEFEFTVSDVDKPNIKEISVDIIKGEELQETKHITANEDGKYVLTLQEEGTYTIQVKAISTFGESSAEVEFNITIDYAAPTPPTNIEMIGSASQEVISNHGVVQESVKIKNSDSAITIEIYQKNATIRLLKINKQGENKTEDFRTDDGFLITEAGAYDIYITSAGADGKTSTIIKHITIEDQEAPKFADQEVIENVDENQSLTGSVKVTDNLKVISYKMKKAPLHGTLELNEMTGEYIYKATSYSAGATDSFEIVAVDKAGNESGALRVTVKIRKVLTVEDCITETNKNFTITENTSKTVELSAKDKNGAELTYTVLGEALHGKVEVLGAKVTYTPDEYYTGKDCFKIKVSNGIDPEIEIDFAVTIQLADEPSIFYDDVDKDAWYYGAIKFVTEKELMNGTEIHLFEPDVSITRGMMATVLYRLAVASTMSKSTFTDVPQDSYYSNAIAWAAENDIVKGVGDNLFEPDREISREEIATMLARYIQNEKVNIASSGVEFKEYEDIQSVSDYAVENVKLMRTLGLMEGKEENHFDPRGLATRAEIATILMRFVIKITR